MQKFLSMTGKKLKTKSICHQHVWERSKTLKWWQFRAISFDTKRIKLKGKVSCMKLRNKLNLIKLEQKLTALQNHSGTSRILLHLTSSSCMCCADICHVLKIMLHGAKAARWNAAESLFSCFLSSVLLRFEN